MKFFVIIIIFLFSAILTLAQSPTEFCVDIAHASHNHAKNSAFQVADTVPQSPIRLDTLSTRPVNESNSETDLQQPDTLDPGTVRQTGSVTVLDAQVDYSAVDSIFFDLRNRKVFLFGEAELRYDQVHLTAAYVEIDFRNNEVFAHGMPDSLGVMQGLPVFTEGEQSFQSKEMRYNFKSKRGRTLGVITEEADGFIHGNVVKIQANRVIHAQDGKYTTCDNPEPHFHIAFRRAKIIPNDKIVTSFAYLVIEGVPLPLVVPFGFFPNKKGQASGILFPSFTESAQRGFGLERGGFYWGINDHVDLALRGDIYSRGSWSTSLESSYRVRYRYSGNFNLGYSIFVQGDEGLPTYQKSRNFKVVWNHNQDPKARPNSTFRASVNAGSSNFTRFNPVSDQEYLTNTFSSSISYSANWAGGYNFSASLRHSQNTLNRRVDLSLPEITFGKSRFNPFRRSQRKGELRWYENINMSYNTNLSNRISTPDSLLFRRETLDLMRNGMNHTIPISHSFRIFNHFNVSNNISYNERWYLNTIRRDWDPTAMQISGADTIYGRAITDTIQGFRAARDFSFSTSVNTQIFGMKQFRRGALRAVRHVVSPSVSFTYRPDFASAFWGYYQEYYNPVLDESVQYSIFEQGIYGGPPRGESGNIGFSLTNNLEMKVRSRRDTITGERKITLIDNLTITGGYDIARDSLNFNDIRVSGRTRLFGTVDITYGSTWTVYETDAQGRSVNRFLWDTRKKPFQLNNTSWAFSLNYSLNSKSKARPNAAGLVGREDPRGMPLNDMYDEPGNGLPEAPDPIMDYVPASINGVDLSVPWNLRFAYQFTYTSRFQPVNRDQLRTVVQNLSVSGDISLTPKWRIGFRSGYDFDRKEITYTSVNVYRDLHCWEMMVDWVPFGFRKSYSLTIKVKSSVLQDLKLTRRTSHLDRQLLDF